jgi:hypothetical protein
MITSAKNHRRFPHTSTGTPGATSWNEKMNSQAILKKMTTSGMP